MRKKTSPVIIKDDDNTRNIIVQVNLKKNTTTVFSGFSTWENLALLLEALAVTAEQCIHEGIARKKVYDAIKEYIMQVLPSYKIKDRL